MIAVSGICGQVHTLAPVKPRIIGTDGRFSSVELSTPELTMVMVLPDAVAVAFVVGCRGACDSLALQVAKKRCGAA